MIPRTLQPVVVRALRDMPVVLVNGARQTGKTTLVRSIVDARPGTRYVSLDDAATLTAAQADPAGFVEGLGGQVAIDEVQKAPGLFPAIKLTVDAERRSGRFLLTGSADVLSLPTISESLAGRMQPVTLWPLSQGEIERRTEGFVDAVCATRFDPPTSDPLDRRNLLDRALRGGFPDAFRRSEPRRRDWFGAYITTILQHDVRDLAAVEHMSAMPRVLSLLALRVGSLLNVSELSRSSGVPNTTLQRYLALLEHTFLVRWIPPWSSNRSKRLVRSPKVALVDPGLLAHLAGISSARLRSDPALAGPLLENLVAVEIWKQLGWSRTRAGLFHFRTHGGREVDLVLEADDGRVVGVEVKAAGSVGKSDFAGLEALREAAGSKFRRGIVLYTGREPLPFGRGAFALPIGSLWGSSGRT